MDKEVCCRKHGRGWTGHTKLLAVTLSAMVLLTAKLQAAEDTGGKSFLAVWATTSNMGLPGLPANMKLDNLPPEAQAQLAKFMGPKRQLEVKLWSPGVAPDNASANLDIPGALKLGKALPLEIERPAAREVGGGGGGATGPAPDFEARFYWGCSDSVREGQPKVIKTADMSPAMRSSMSKGKARSWYKPDWTDAFWPNGTSRAQAMIAQDSSLHGDYALHSTYTGQPAFTVTQPVDFLDGISLTSPGQSKKPDLKRAIPLSWNRIPNSLGYYLMAMGAKGQNLMIMWTASENENAMGAEMDFPQMAEVRAMVEKGTVLPPDRTSCTIPAGIFEGCKMVTIRIIAYGPGQAFEDQEPLVRVQTKSVGMLSLGMKMPQGEGMEGMEGKEEGGE